MPKLKTFEQKQREGAYEKNPQRAPNCPAPIPAATDPPKGLTKRQREKWQYLAECLVRLGVYGDDCREAMRHYVDQFERYKKAQTAIRKYGIVIERQLTNGGGVGVTKNPACDEAEKAVSQMIKLLARMGLTPVDRQKLVSQSATGSMPDDPMQDLLAKAGARIA